MKVGLFIPCYIDQFYPQVAAATLELLERLDCEVVFPLNQTCCGQPLANSGFADLPFASSLCGSCSNVCPVKIDIHKQLWKWRQVLTEEGYAGSGKMLVMKAMSFVLSNPAIYRIAGKLGRWVMRYFPILMANKIFNPWYKQREMPEAPTQSFRDWYKNNKR